MTGHAFQVLLDDDELHASLAAIRSALTEAGRFAFETRNPLARQWERWTPENATEFTDASGALVRYECEVDTPVDGDLVRFRATYTCPTWERAETSHSTLRFLDAASLVSFLSSTGFTIEKQFGDWTGRPLTDTSPEIITIARSG